MKVRILESVAGTVPGTDEPFSFAPGEERDLDSKWAKALLEGGTAAPVASRAVDRAEKRPGRRSKSESR